MNGLLAYAFFVVATRALGASAAAPVSVLWTYWSAAAAVLTFPLQHWMIRTLAADAHEAAVARALPRIWAGAAALAVLATLVAFAGRHALFHRGGVAFPLLVGGVTAVSCLTGSVRGALAGRGRYVSTAWSMVADNAARVLLAVLAAVAGAGPVAYGVALVAGALALLRWRPALRFRPGPSPPPGQGRPLGLMSGLAAGSLIGQVVLTSAPIALVLSGGAPAEVTSLFAALAVWRAPYLLALGVAPQLTHRLTRLAAAGQQHRLARVRRTTVLAVAAAAVLAAAAGATVLRPLLRAVFGQGVVLDPLDLALLGVGTAVALGNLLLLLLLLAYGRSRAGSLAWAAALGVFAGWVLLAGMDPLHRVVLAFLAAQVTAFVLLLATARPPAMAAPPAAAGEPLAGPAVPPGACAASDI